MLATIARVTVIVAVGLVVASSASAQSAARRAPEAVQPAAITLEAFTAEVAAAAVAAGISRPADTAIRAAFASLDANGNGHVEASEAMSQGTPGCSTRGICVHGRCFCVPGSAGRTAETQSVATDSPIFIAPNETQQNVLNP